jgi:hypothetical protein
MEAKNRHCQKNWSLEPSSTPDSCAGSRPITALNLFKITYVRSYSSLVSSSKPGSSAKMMAFNADRSITGLTAKMNVSKSDKRAGLTDNDANDRVGDNPGR